MRSNLNTVVPKTETKVTIAHTIQNNSICTKTKYFSQVEPYYSDKKPNSYFGVLKLHSLSSLLEQLHTSSSTAKDKAHAILKGLYIGGTKGQYCTSGTPFLFFDIDVKETENKHLYDAKANADVFEQLEEISVIVWRSNSKRGIAGILYVPQLEDYLSTKSVEHLKIGKAITDYLQKKLKVNATFDNAQSKFRQIRFLAKQDEQRTINTNPYTFNFELKEIEVFSNTGVKQFNYSNGRAALGSIQQQFNAQQDIHTALTDCGLQNVGGERYKHPSTTSNTTGQVVNNVFFNHSNSFSNYSVFTPYWLYFTQGGYNSIADFEKELMKQGYQVKKPSVDVFKKAENVLKNNVDRNKVIFEACFDLVNLPYKQRIAFAKKHAKDEKELIIFNDYLNLKPLTIKYDKTLQIKKYVSEQIKSVLDFTDNYSKIILTAETGTGKTSAFLRDFKKHRPNARLLIFAPLTIIIDQTKANYPNVIALTGNSEPKEHTNAKTASIVIATYEQGVKHLKDRNKFDYIVIDEAHNLINGHNYKPEQIKELTSLLFRKKVIGLTGTTTPLFQNIGYKLLNIKKEQQTKVGITMRADNRDATKIILQHISKIKSKAVFRLNNVESLKELKKDLIKHSNYTDNQVLVLQSSIGVKQGGDFKTLSNESRFGDEVKIILTTGLIDEGLSINQKGFSDMVFIETEYNPTPEAMKQFFARFRNEDLNRTNYYYFKEKRIQKKIAWNPIYDFNNRLNDLREEIDTPHKLGSKTDNPLTNNSLFYSNGMIDLFCLANEVKNTFFKLCTTEELMLFIETNYNITPNLDNEYLKLDQDTSIIKGNKKANKELIISTWHNNFESVEHAIAKLTASKQLKKEIEYNGEPVEYNILDSVSANLKTFEFLYNSYVSLKKLNIDNPNAILFENNKLDRQKIKRKIDLYQIIDLINNPNNKTEEKNKNKLLKFKDEVCKKTEFKTKDLFRIWKKFRVSSMNVTPYNLADLIIYFKPYNYNRKTGIYSVKLYSG